MTYEEIVARVKEAAKDADVSGVKEHAAYQINITGEGEGAFYIEINNGELKVEPYEYFDRDILVFTSAADLMDILDGKTDFINAHLDGKISAEGDLSKAEFLKNITFKEAAKKEPSKKAAAPKKPAAKKTSAKKAPAKKAAKK